MISLNIGFKENLLMKSNLLIGRWGEQIAEEYLIRQGIEILARNVRTPYGEIDIIGRQGELVLFEEVKTRTNTAFGFPEDSITKQKKQHLFQNALAYIQAHPELGEHWRIDVLSIQGTPGKGKPQIEWFVNVDI
jgi:putative endonuclease